MIDRFYRWFERPLLAIAFVLYVIYYPAAVIDSGHIHWGTFIGALFWLAQGVVMVYVARWVKRRAIYRAWNRHK